MWLYHQPLIQCFPSSVLCMFAHFTGTGGQQQPPQLCAQGHYCPEGTQYPSQYPCPAGTWTNLTNLAASDECYVCPRGYYCLVGSTEPTGLCATGHYCPAGNIGDEWLKGMTLCCLSNFPYWWQGGWWDQTGKKLTHSQTGRVTSKQMNRYPDIQTSMNNFYR